MKPLKLCLVAPSGSGKSTAAQMLRAWFVAHGLSVDVIKLAAPLYRLQSQFYAEAGLALAPGAQDQHLLEAVARQLRAIDPLALVHAFRRGLDGSRADVVINDDLRDDAIDWPALRNAGFVVVKLVTRRELRAQRLALRRDLSVVHDSPLDLQIARIRADCLLTNNGSLDELRAQVDGLCRLLTQEQVAA